MKKLPKHYIDATNGSFIVEGMTGKRRSSYRCREQLQRCFQQREKKTEPLRGLYFVHGESKKAFINTLTILESLGFPVDIEQTNFDHITFIKLKRKWSKHVMNFSLLTLILRVGSFNRFTKASMVDDIVSYCKSRYTTYYYYGNPDTLRECIYKFLFRNYKFKDTIYNIHKKIGEFTGIVSLCCATNCNWFMKP